MSIMSLLRKLLLATGYPADTIIDDYVFSDVLAARPTDRRVAMAAFTQTPPSYRTAVIAAVTGHAENAADVIQDYRALGAPLLLLCGEKDVAIWQVRSEDAPRVVARAGLEELPALFEQHRADWNPAAIHRAKSI